MVIRKSPDVTSLSVLSESRPFRRPLTIISPSIGWNWRRPLPSQPCERCLAACSLTVNNVPSRQKRVTLCSILAQRRTQAWMELRWSVTRWTTEGTKLTLALPSTSLNLRKMLVLTGQFHRRSIFPNWCGSKMRNIYKDRPLAPEFWNLYPQSNQQIEKFTTWTSRITLALRNFTSLTMRFLILLLVVAMFAATIAAQDSPSDVKFNPDDPIQVDPIQGADDDATACENGSGDGRATRACCLGQPEAPTPDGGFVRVYKCRKCKRCSQSSGPTQFLWFAALLIQFHVRNRCTWRAGLRVCRRSQILLRKHTCKFYHLVFVRGRVPSRHGRVWCHDASE